MDSGAIIKEGSEYTLLSLQGSLFCIQGQSRMSGWQKTTVIWKSSYLYTVSNRSFLYFCIFRPVCLFDQLYFSTSLSIQVFFKNHKAPILPKNIHKLSQLVNQTQICRNCSKGCSAAVGRSEGGLGVHIGPLFSIMKFPIFSIVNNKFIDCPTR